VADYAMRNLHLYLDEELASAKSESQIKQAIERSFDRVEEDVIKMAEKPFKFGFSKVANTGSCALVAIVHDDKLYVANAGDCKATVLRKTEDGKSFTNVDISKTFSANKSYEQERLKKTWPNDPNIFVCRSERACYVKNGLMPSRAFGDLRLKMKEFNYHSFSPEHGYRRPIPDFEGPYITHKPDIKVHTIDPKDKWLVLASDGLWDEMKRKDSARMVDPQQENQNEILQLWLKKAIEHARNEANLSKEFLQSVPPGPRRREIHDDITILLINLENQLK